MPDRPSHEEMCAAVRWQIRKLESFAQGRAAEAYEGDLEIFRAILIQLEASRWRPIGWPGGDIVTYECRNCGHRWKAELPQ